MNYTHITIQKTVDDFFYLKFDKIRFSKTKKPSKAFLKFKYLLNVNN